MKRLTILTIAALLIIVALSIPTSQPQSGITVVASAIAPTAECKSGDCCDLKMACGSAAQALYDLCMNSEGPTKGELYCRKKKADHYKTCIEQGGQCSPGCMDMRSGLIVPCPGETDNCTYP